MDVISSLPSILDLASASQRTEINLDTVTDQANTIKIEGRPTVSPADNTTLSQNAKDLSLAETLARKMVTSTDEGVANKLTEFYAGTIKTLREEYGEKGVSDFVNSFDTVDSFEQLLERRYRDAHLDELKDFTGFQDIMIRAVTGFEAITGESFWETPSMPYVSNSVSNSDLDVINLIKSGKNKELNEESEAHKLSHQQTY